MVFYVSPIPRLRGLRDLPGIGQVSFPIFSESEEQPHVKEVNGVPVPVQQPSLATGPGRVPSPAATAGSVSPDPRCQKSPPETQANCMIRTFSEHVNGILPPRRLPAAGRAVPEPATRQPMEKQPASCVVASRRRRSRRQSAPRRHRRLQGQAANRRRSGGRALGSRTSSVRPCPGLEAAQRRTRARDHARARVACRRSDGVGAPNYPSRLEGQPVRSRADAALPASRATTQFSAVSPKYRVRPGQSQERSALTPFASGKDRARQPRHSRTLATCGGKGEASPFRFFAARWLGSMARRSAPLPMLRSRPRGGRRSLVQCHRNTVSPKHLTSWMGSYCCDFSEVTP
jgi:hypothetical protein